MADLTDLEAAGWRIDVEGEEVRAEHADSGRTYVFDAEGGVRVPEGEGVAGDLRDLRTAIASIEDGDGAITEPGTEVDSIVTRAGMGALEEASTAACTIECDETTGEVTIRADNSVSMRAPVVDIAGRSRVDISSPGVVNVFEEPDVASIEAFPNGATATDSVHRVEVPVTSDLDGTALSTVAVDYPPDFDASGVTAGDVLGAGVERADGTIVFVEVSEVASSDSGTTVTFNVGSDIQIGTDDTVILEYRRVTNASTEGDYAPVVDVNGVEIGPGTLSIGPETDTPDPVVSTFDEGDGGWEISGDAQGSSVVPNYEDAVGNPPPSVSAVDDVAGGVWYFDAPGKFLADKSAFYGGTLEYDLRQEFSGSPDQFDAGDIVLSGGGMTLTYDHGDASSHPGGGESGSWTSYSVRLAETDDWTKGDGSSVSASEMETVLADLTALRIRGEYRTGSDTGYLDNVKLSPGSGTPEGELVLEPVPDGPRQSVAPIEGEGSVSEFYGFDTANPDSADLPDELTVADATVTFVYRDVTTGAHSLVIVNDDPASDTGGAAAVALSGVSGAEWLVQDGPPGNDSYETPDGSVGELETAAWNWPGDVTDGGAIGPLGETFDFVVSHRAAASVGDTTVERSGLDRWLFVDGADPANPIELANFAENPVDASARVATGGGLEAAFEGLQLLLNGDTAVATPEGNVEAWSDASENGFEFTQEDSAKRPTLVEDAINGHPALRFDGEDDRFIHEGTLGIPNDSARTFFVVCRLTDTAARSPYLMQGKFDATGTGSNAYGMEANTYNTAGERFGLYLISAAKDAELSTDTNYNVHVLRTADASSLSAMEETTTYYVNGERIPFEGTGGGVRNEQLEADSTAIGSFPHSSPETLMHGEIAEIFVFDRALPDEERSVLEAALFDKYGLGT